ncbi:MAG: hypothetical protein KAX37_09025, partial [Opitutaceae bacterium]|nr:hypothetical protein [Opitutaceae bacterium]
LRSGSQAREYLQTVAREAGAPPAGTSPTGELAELANMAKWRLKQLDWEDGTDRQLNTFFQTSGSPNGPVMATTPVATPQT